jgi:hypothetical protein
LPIFKGIVRPWDWIKEMADPVAAEAFALSERPVIGLAGGDPGFLDDSQAFQAILVRVLEPIWLTDVPMPTVSDESISASDQARLSEFLPAFTFTHFDLFRADDLSGTGFLWSTTDTGNLADTPSFGWLVSDNAFLTEAGQSLPQPRDLAGIQESTSQTALLSAQDTFFLGGSLSLAAVLPGLSDTGQANDAGFSQQVLTLADTFLVGDISADRQLALLDFLQEIDLATFADVACVALDRASLLDVGPVVATLAVAEAATTTDVAQNNVPNSLGDTATCNDILGDRSLTLADYGQSQDVVSLRGASLASADPGTFWDTGFPGVSLGTTGQAVVTEVAAPAFVLALTDASLTTESLERSVALLDFFSAGEATALALLALDQGILTLEQATVPAAETGTFLDQGQVEQLAWDVALLADQGTAPVVAVQTGDQFLVLANVRTSAGLALIFDAAAVRESVDIAVAYHSSDLAQITGDVAAMFTSILMPEAASFADSLFIEAALTADPDTGLTLDNCVGGPAGTLFLTNPLPTLPIGM